MTRVIAVAMVKDEIDILPYVIDHYDKEGIDAFYIIDNGSTDGTLEYLQIARQADMHATMWVWSDSDPAYYQAQKMNALVKRAIEVETHFDEIFGDSKKVILPFDADEMFYAIDPFWSLSDALRSMGELDAYTLATVYDHVPHPTDNNNELNPLRRMIHRMPHIKSPPSAAFTYHPDAHLAMGNHNVGHPGELREGLIGVRHFQYRSLEQYIRKLRNGKQAYDATDLPEMYGAHWREGGAKSDEQLTNEWNAYMAQPSIYDPAPLKGKK